MTAQLCHYVQQILQMGQHLQPYLDELSPLKSCLHDACINESLLQQLSDELN